jgi:hypothetical protein
MICYFELGRYEEGREYRERVLKTDRYNPAANFYLAKDAIGVDEYLKAGLFLRATAKDPNWNERAEPMRRLVAEKVLGPGGAAATAISTTTTTTTTNSITEP